MTTSRQGRKHGKGKVYEIITDRIIAELEKGTVPWQKAWKTQIPPMNIITHREYRGINILVLSLALFSSPFFATFKQVNQLGGRIKKGEKGHPIVFWKFPVNNESQGNIFSAENDNANETKKAPILRCYTVFNVDQCEGLEGALPEEDNIEFVPIEECEKAIAGYVDRPKIEHANGVACYRPSADNLFIPKPECFSSLENYYGTLFHELVHSTGHEKRLGREEMKTLSVYGDHKYSKEELIAEIGASFLCNKTHIDIPSIFENQVAYIGSWLKVLKNDKRMIIYAAAKAQKAVDYILNIKEEIP